MDKDAEEEPTITNTIPEFDDPFDTSIYSFEPVKDAVKVTDERTFDAFAAKFDSVASSGIDTNTVNDAFSSPLPTRKMAPGETGFEQSAGFDPFIAAAPAPIVVRKRPP